MWGNGRRAAALALAAIAACALPRAAAADGGIGEGGADSTAGAPAPAPHPVFPARVQEAARYAALRERLTAARVDFEERPLLEMYGAFGTSILVRAGGSLPRVVLAVPILSEDEAFAGAPANADAPPAGTVPVAGTSSAPAPLTAPPAAPPAAPLTTAQEAALVLIQNLRGGVPASTDTSPGGAAAPAPALDIFFLGDCWLRAAGSGHNKRYNFAAWQDLLVFYAEEEETPPLALIFLDAQTPARQLSIYTGVGSGRLPFEYVQKISALAARAALPVFYDHARSGYNAEISARLAVDFAYDVPALFLSAGTRAAFLPTSARAISAQELAELLLTYAREAGVPPPAPGDSELNYLAFWAGKKHLLIHEKTAVAAALAVFTFIGALLWLLYRQTRHAAPLGVGIAVALVFAMLLFAPPLGQWLFLRRTESAGGAHAPADFTRVPPDGLVGVEQKAHRFLRRVPLTLTIRSSKEPVRFCVRFTGLRFGASPADEAPAPQRLPFLYESPVPVLDGERSLELYLGDYPPNPLTLELALPEELTGELTVDTYWTDGTRASVNLQTPALPPD